MARGKLTVSIMCADLLNLQSEISRIEKIGVDYLHIDIMDATFVPNLTFGPDLVNSLRGITSLPFDIHLLMDHPSVIIRSLNISENDIVSIHCECKDSIMENIAFVKQRHAKFGLALSPDSSIKEVKKYLPYVDIILLMLIVPGFAGTSMIHGMMEKVGETRKYLDDLGYTNVEISVDGSVSAERAEYMHGKGATIFVGGTAGIFRKGMKIEETIPNFLEHIK